MEKVSHRPLPLEVPAQLDKLIDADIAHQLLTHYEAYVKEVGQAMGVLSCVLCTLQLCRLYLTCASMRHTRLQASKQKRKRTSAALAPSVRQRRRDGAAAAENELRQEREAAAAAPSPDVQDAADADGTATRSGLQQVLRFLFLLLLRLTGVC